METIAFRVDLDTRQKLQREAIEEGQRLSDIARRYLNRGMSFTSIQQPEKTEPKKEKEKLPWKS